MLLCCYYAAITVCWTPITMRMCVRVTMRMCTCTLYSVRQYLCEDLLVGLHF